MNSASFFLRVTGKSLTRRIRARHFSGSRS
jgi:hypothetical protein